MALTAANICSGFDGVQIAVPPEHWPGPVEGGLMGLVKRLLQLARGIALKRVTASKRAPKRNAPKGYIGGKTARAHVATARVMAKAKLTP